MAACGYSIRRFLWVVLCPLSRTHSSTAQKFPIRAWHEHSREVFGVDWSPTDKTQFATYVIELISSISLTANVIPVLLGTALLK